MWLSWRRFENKLGAYDLCSESWAGINQLVNYRRRLFFRDPTTRRILLAGIMTDRQCFFTAFRENPRFAHFQKIHADRWIKFSITTEHVYKIMKSSFSKEIFRESDERLKRKKKEKSWEKRCNYVCERDRSDWKAGWFPHGAKHLSIAQATLTKPKTTSPWRR